MLLVILLSLLGKMPHSATSELGHCDVVDVSLPRRAVRGMSSLIQTTFLTSSPLKNQGLLPASIRKLPRCGSRAKNEQVHESWPKLRQAYTHLLGHGFSPNASGILVPHEVRLVPGEGRGLFATAPIHAGTRVWTPVNLVRFIDDKTFREFLATVPLEQVCDILGYAFSETLSNGTKSVSLDFDNGSFINHGGKDKANIGCPTGMNIVKCEDSYALRDIHAGEEILDDYTSYNVKVDWWDALKREANWNEFNNLEGKVYA